MLKKAVNARNNRTKGNKSSANGQSDEITCDKSLIKNKGKRLQGVR